MIRVVLTQLALFLAPFAVYAVYLVVRKRPLFSGDGSLKAGLWLAFLGAFLSVGFLLAFGERDSAPPGSRYIPPHMEDGVYVPGRFLPPSAP